MELYERIKTCRQRCGLTQEQVAEAMNVSRQAVTKWENGSSAPSTQNLFKLAQLFGTTVDFLAQDEKPEVPPQKSILQNTKLWICVICCFFFFVLVTPFEISMYTPQLFQLLCILLNFWTVVWFGVLLYLLLAKKGAGENRGLFMGVLLLTAVGHVILGLFFWQCWVCVGVSVVFLSLLFLEKYRKNRKKY
jgi:DNA-binding XRE family transcriptional regulator